MVTITKTPSPRPSANSEAPPTTANAAESAKLRSQARELVQHNPSLKAVVDKANKSHGILDHATADKVTAEVAKAVAKNPWWSKQPPAAQKEAAGRYAAVLLLGSKASSTTLHKGSGNTVLDQASKLLPGNPGLGAATDKAIGEAVKNNGKVSPATARTVNDEVAKAVAKNPYWSKQPAAAQQKATKDYSKAFLDGAADKGTRGKITEHFLSALKNQ